MSTTDVITATTDLGDTLPFRAQKARESGNTYWAVLARRAHPKPGQSERYFNPRGVTVDHTVIQDLPTSVEVLGVSIPLTHAVQTGKGGAPKANGKRQARGSAPVQVPGHGSKVAKVCITDLGGNAFQVTASITGAGTGGSSKGLSAAEL